MVLQGWRHGLLNIPQDNTTYIGVSCHAMISPLQMDSSEDSESKEFPAVSMKIKRSLHTARVKTTHWDWDSSWEQRRFQPGLWAPTKGTVTSDAPYTTVVGPLLPVWKGSWYTMRKVEKKNPGETSLAQLVENKDPPSSNKWAWPWLHLGGEFHPRAPQELHLFGQLSAVPTDLV